jgi:hypothetical protein
MTPENIAQITAIVAAAEQRTAAAILASEQRMCERMERFVEALTHNLSDVREELLARLETIERRTERTEISVNSILMQLAGISRSMTQGEQLTSQVVATHYAQQRAFDALVARVARIERQLNLEQQ